MTAEACREWARPAGRGGDRPPRPRQRDRPGAGSRGLPRVPHRAGRAGARRRAARRRRPRPPRLRRPGTTAELLDRIVAETRTARIRRRRRRTGAAAAALAAAAAIVLVLLLAPLGDDGGERRRVALAGSAGPASAVLEPLRPAPGSSSRPTIWVTTCTGCR
ncbi:MAG: hypothetical protein U5R31_06110 [Acidimicrobiia bacterium]|nr:hypothetical protein [Acidimicrobiia bacterium]